MKYEINTPGKEEIVAMIILVVIVLLIGWFAKPWNFNRGGGWSECQSIGGGSISC